MAFLIYGTAGLPAGKDGQEGKLIGLGVAFLITLVVMPLGIIGVKNRCVVGRWGVTVTGTRGVVVGMIQTVTGGLLGGYVLYGLIYGVQLGIGGPKKDMSVLMTLNNNGQGITLSNQIKDKGVTDGASLAQLVAKKEREYTFAQTFPTGTHGMWLYYWLAAYGVNPMKDAKVITVPPPQMVANMRVDKMDGFCVGEPWNHRAIIDGIGITAATSQDSKMRSME